MKETYVLTSLENGLRVIIAPMDTSSVSCLVLVGVGSRYEQPSLYGLSHFLEHMMFKGTKKRPSAFQIAQEIDSIGGINNAYTSRDHTGYYIKAAQKHVEKVMEILSDMTLNSLFQQEEIKREKGVIIQEMMMYNDTPIRRIEEEFEKGIYGNNTGLGHPIIGNEKTVTSFVRNNFLSFVQTFYRPNNAVVVVSGGVNVQKISQLARNFFGKWKKANTPSYIKDQRILDTSQVFLIQKNTDQTHLCIGTYAYPRTDKRRYTVQVLSAILGGGMSSRLFINVRERRGLAYYIKSWSNLYQDSGSFITQAGVDVKKLSEAIKVIVDEYRKLAKKENVVTDEELNRAKEYVKGHIILSFEDSMNVARFYGNSLLLDGKLRTLSKVISAIDRISKDDIYQTAYDLFIKKPIQLAVIGPLAEKKRTPLLKIIS